MHRGPVEFWLSIVLFIEFPVEIEGEYVGPLIHRIRLVRWITFIPWHIIVLVISVHTLCKLSSVNGCLVIRRSGTRLIILYDLWLEHFLQHLCLLLVTFLFQLLHLGLVVLLIIVESSHCFLFPWLRYFPRQSRINLRINKLFLDLPFLLGHLSHFLLSSLLLWHQLIIFVAEVLRGQMLFLLSFVILIIKLLHLPFLIFHRGSGRFLAAFH